MFFAIILYGTLTVAGLFPFYGIPVINVALGFPLGAVVAHYYRRRPPGSPAWVSAERQVLRGVLTWALATSGLTMVLCWFQLAAFLMTIHFIGPAPEILRWIPLVHPTQGVGLFPSQSFASVQLFAILLAPGIQVLTTVFGAVVGILLDRRPHQPPLEEPRTDPTPEWDRSNP